MRWANCKLGEHICRVGYPRGIAKQRNVKVLAVLHLFSLNIFHARCIYPTIEVMTVAFPAHEELRNATFDPCSQDFIDLKRGVFRDSNRCLPLIKELPI